MICDPPHFEGGCMANRDKATRDLDPYLDNKPHPTNHNDFQLTSVSVKWDVNILMFCLVISRCCILSLLHRHTTP